MDRTDLGSNSVVSRPVLTAARRGPACAGEGGLGRPDGLPCTGRRVGVFRLGLFGPARRPMMIDRWGLLQGERAHAVPLDVLCGTMTIECLHDLFQRS
ncbi:MAG TPA: hypothetical protein VK281_08700, partial [Xanthobacteraceae bacterium]|nr:hypothetical protein [Xanthobacteraceae bacterium]